MNHRCFVVFALAAAACLPTLAQTDCDSRGKLEADAVVRDYGARAPAKGNAAAEQAWAQGLHDALKAVEQRHEACRRSSQPTPTAAQTQRLEACLDANRRQFDAMDKRYQGRTLSFQEQTQWRTEQQKLLDERNACTRQR